MNCYQIKHLLTDVRHMRIGTLVQQPKRTQATIVDAILEQRDKDVKYGREFWYEAK